MVVLWPAVVFGAVCVAWAFLVAWRVGRRSPPRPAQRASARRRAA